MTQDSLFTLLPDTPAIPSVPRKERRERAHRNANPEVMERYEQVLKSAGSVLVRFIAAEITAEYEKRHGKLSLSDSRGLGGLYADLQHRGVIRKTGEWRSRKNGNASLEYQLVRANA